jgi:TolA-binding protein
LLRGKITDTAPGEITIEVQGRPRKITVNEIRAVRMGGEPAFLRQAREAIANRQLDQAQQDLDRVTGSGLDAMIAEELTFYRVYLAALQALESGKGTGDAEAAILQFVRAHPNNYHFFEAAEILGDLAMQQNNFELAGKYYAQLRKAPWSSAKLRGTVLEAEALRIQGGDKLPEARRRFAAVAQAQSSDPDGELQKALAVVGKAACDAQLGGAAAAISELEQVIARNDPAQEELFARSYNALGDCYRAENKPTDAALAYLHVDLLFYRESDAHAEALYNLARVWDQLGKPDRATEARSTLKSRYAGSIWARR